MQVVRCINNNVAVCVDKDGREVVVFGKGVGFKKPPYEISLSQIDRTFYGVDMKNIQIVNNIDMAYFETSTKIANLARLKLETQISSNIVFTLADHINFCIKRHKEGIVLKMPNYYDIQHLYEKEYEVGKEALKIINKDFNVRLPKTEIASIAIHIINSEYTLVHEDEKNDNIDVIKEVTNCIEKYFKLRIDKNGFNYSRFVSHMQYLLKRNGKCINITSENLVMFKKVKESFPKTYKCVDEVNEIIKYHYDDYLNDEELLYLMLHINRLCSCEDCYR